MQGSPMQQQLAVNPLQTPLLSAGAHLASTSSESPLRTFGKSWKLMNSSCTHDRYRQVPTLEICKPTFEGKLSTKANISH